MKIKALIKEACLELILLIQIHLTEIKINRMEKNLFTLLLDKICQRKILLISKLKKAKHN
jgi:hypothetical protein